jgi:hypothetical protein
VSKELRTKLFCLWTAVASARNTICRRGFQTTTPQIVEARFASTEESAHEEQHTQKTSSHSPTRGPLVPGSKGGGLAHWKLERDKQELNNEIADLARSCAELSQKLIEDILFLKDPTRKTPGSHSAGKWSQQGAA